MCTSTTSARKLGKPLATSIGISTVPLLPPAGFYTLHWCNLSLRMAITAVIHWTSLKPIGWNPLSGLSTESSSNLGNSPTKTSSNPNPFFVKASRRVVTLLSCDTSSRHSTTCAPLQTNSDPTPNLLFEIFFRLTRLSAGCLSIHLLPPYETIFRRMLSSAPLWQVSKLMFATTSCSQVPLFFIRLVSLWFSHFHILFCFVFFLPVHFVFVCVCGGGCLRHLFNWVLVHYRICPGCLANCYKWINVNKYLQQNLVAKKAHFTSTTPPHPNPNKWNGCDLFRKQWTCTLSEFLDPKSFYVCDIY